MFLIINYSMLSNYFIIQQISITQMNNNQQHQDEGDWDDDQIVKSVSKVFVNQALKKGPSYYNYQDINEFKKIQWKDGSIYVCEQKLGRGKYSEVFEAININNSKKCVIKMLKPINQKKVMRQIKLLMSLQGHQNIIQLVDLIKYLLSQPSDKNKYIALFFRDQSPLTLKMFFLTAILSILRLQYCHSMGIMHRDIKPSNIIIDLQTRQVKLIDWGLGQFYLPKKNYNVHVASRYYKPPQLLVGYEYYHYSLDIWSFGALMAVAIFKHQPLFKGSDNNDQLQKINQVLGSESLYAYIKKYNILLPEQVDQALGCHKPRKLVDFIDKNNKQFATPDAIDLMQKILVYDHDLRPTAQQCMKHPYFDEVRSLFVKNN